LDKNLLALFALQPFHAISGNKILTDRFINGIKIKIGIIRRVGQRVVRFLSGVKLRRNGCGSPMYPVSDKA